MPGRQFGRGAIYHVTDGALVLWPLVAVAPVVLGNLEILVRRRLALVKAAQLLVDRDRHPELDDHRAGFDRDCVKTLLDLFPFSQS